jgi:hypothetical protein
MAVIRVMAVILGMGTAVGTTIATVVELRSIKASGNPVVGGTVRLIYSAHDIISQQAKNYVLTTSITDTRCLCQSRDVRAAFEQGARECRSRNDKEALERELNERCRGESGFRAINVN